MMYQDIYLKVKEKIENDLSGCAVFGGQPKAEHSRPACYITVLPTRMENMDSTSHDIQVEITCKSTEMDFYNDLLLADQLFTSMGSIQVEERQIFIDKWEASYEDENLKVTGNMNLTTGKDMEEVEKMMNLHLRSEN
ncbi:phage tail terminator family protein [Vallitalea okinawensis]|uniref:phage tail terminator family protein n=1 Tax=Vallitalea okinawensis TaxID=2078660 RepID=UPI000CFAD872|nr:hypothetical protein [Vallitalea okinawensis]